MDKPKFKYKNKFLILAIFFISFFIFINKKFVLENIGRPMRNNFFSFTGRLRFIKNSCSIPLVDKVPKESTVLIGHAYGSHSLSKERELNMKDFIAPVIQKFLEDQKLNIKTVIFTGDVFRIPSYFKWIKLKSKYKNDFEILVAPGNHDIGYLYNDSKREIFSEVIKQLDSYPFLYSTSGFEILIDNSIDNKYVYNLISKNLLNKNNENLIIIRHHIPIKELRFLSNDRIWTKDLPSSKKVSKYIKNVTFISGDGGAFSYLQRIGCLSIDSNKFIVNGIGENDDDRIIILNNEKILQYKINKKN